MREIVPATTIGQDGSDAEPHEPVRGPESDYLPESDTEASERGPDENWIFWHKQITAALAHERRWRVEALEADTLYFGEDTDPGANGKPEDRITDKTALIHANIDTLKPMLYSETPQPVVRRRWRGDGKSDETDLQAAEAAQRLAAYILDTERFDDMMERVRDDWLITGRGAGRVYYAADIIEVEIQDEAGVTMKVAAKASERVYARGTEWRRLLLAGGHSWDELPWLAFEIPMTRSRVEKRFGREVCARMAFTRLGMQDTAKGISDDDRDVTSFDRSEDETGEVSASPFDTAVVWEIWNRESGTVIWWSPNFKDDILDKEPDPLGLEGFYPMPKPLLATTKGEQMTPRPDVKYYEQRAKEIDLATEKMREILNVISVSGLFPGEITDQIKQLLSGKSQMVPVSNWLSLMQKGGIKDAIQWLPLQEMVAALQALALLREQAKNAMFEASGVSDIMRAQGDPTETATAQNLKGRYAGLRLKDRQRKIAVYARDMLRLMIEIGVEHFDTETLASITGLDLPMTEADRAMIAAQAAMVQQQIKMVAQDYQTAQRAGLQLPPPPEPPEVPEVPGTSWELVHARLRSDVGRKITVSIETDSTVLADEMEDKQLRVEFIQAFSMFVERLAPLVSTGMFEMKLVKELLLFGIRGFPKARTLESMIMQLPDDAEAPNQGPPVQVQVAQIRAEVDKMKVQAEAVDSEKDRQHEMRMKGVDLMADAAHTAGQPPQSPEKP
ncbi:MAG: hypothetical protein LCH92_08175 [Proteobacteria bacterium]|nr:hypothetical protein [Pseudomonadota bacterium]